MVTFSKDSGSNKSVSLPGTGRWFVYFEGYRIKKAKMIDIGLCTAFTRIFGTFFMDGNLGHWIV